MVFDSPIRLWQVPRDTYRQAVVTFAELNAKVRPTGRLGEHLVSALERVMLTAAKAGRDLGETYILGDNPLVLLTALQSSFHADPSSSRYAILPAPLIDDRGRYVPRSDGRPIRVYTGIDVRLMFGDLFAKIGAIGDGG